MVARTFRKKEHVEKKKKKISKPAIFAIIIGVVMVLSTIGYTLTSGLSDSEKYEGFNLLKVGNYWAIEQVDKVYASQHPTKTKILNFFGFSAGSKKMIYFSVFPSQADQINASKSAIDKIKNSKMLYVSFYPNSTDSDAQFIDYARFQLAKDLGENFDTYLVQSKSANLEDKLVLPVIGCENATASVPVIMIRTKQESTSLREEGNCIMMDAAQGYDLVLMRDKITYSLLGVLK